MTQNEVDIIKNAVLDATEAYVDARLDVLDFVKTQIGVVMEAPVKRTDRKYVHKVRCNATQSNPNGIVYNNVLSVGNIPFPQGSVVFLLAPNAQFSNQFILGKLDDTPCNISAGSITLGNAIYLTSTPEWDDSQHAYSYGHIAKFKIFNDFLTVGDAKLSEKIIGCGQAGYGIINMVGGQNDNAGSYLQVSDSGTPTECIDGVRIYGYDGGVRGMVRFYDSNGVEIRDSDRSLRNIPEKTIYADSDGYLHWS